MSSWQQAAGSEQPAGISRQGLGIRDWGLGIGKEISNSQILKSPNPQIPKSLNPSRRAFTLVDLLVAAAIIGILAAIVLGALGSARQHARIDKTRSLITRLHYVVMEKYDSYRTRRVPINTSGLPPAEAARRRVNAIRDLMRMEMPDRWSDIAHPDYPDDVTKVPLCLPTVPSLTQRYRRIFNQNHDDARENKSKDTPSAELLYMIVMAIPEAADQFHESEIADTDNDGLPEFVDAWGNPIRFIRWPAGFIPANQADSDLQDGATPDPFDPRGIVSRDYPNPNPNTVTPEYALFPLIFSAGPDQQFDITEGRDASRTNTSGEHAAYVCDLSVYGNLRILPDPGRLFKGIHVGRPLEVDWDPNADSSTWFDDLRHYDNIHNHRLETGRGR